MDLWQIRGGRRLDGSCTVQGSKNASLPILAATLLAPGRVELYNVPRLRDVDAALRILRALGAETRQEGHFVSVDSCGVSACSVPRTLMEQMRSSVIFMGALIARCGEAKLSLPGGCQLGRRPIDLHLDALRQMGVEIEQDGDDIACRSRGLHGAQIRLPFPSVGATENVLLAACGAKGRTCLSGAAREPEIVALQGFLRALGAEISGAGTDCIVVEGFHPRRSAAALIPPDRIAAATLCCACASAGGEIELNSADPEQISTVLYFLKQAGCDIIHAKRSLRVSRMGRLCAPERVTTAPYPGFPTDAQPVLMAALLRAEGTSTLRDSIFENRFRQIPELRRLGADIRLEGQTALIRGVERLHGDVLRATDLRGGAAMVLAGLAAEGDTLVLDEGHITRGYDDLDGCLRALGADVWAERI